MYASRAGVLFKTIIAYSLLVNIFVLMCVDVQPSPGPNPNRKTFNICHANIRSLKNADKFNEIQCELGNTYDIVTFSEKWLCEKDKSCNYMMVDYQTPFRRDRTLGSTGYGGVAAYVSDNLACKRRRNLEIPEIEGLWLEINVINTKFLLLVIYRTESNSNNLFWQTLQTNIDDVRSESNSLIMIIGDLNADPQTRHGRCLSEFADNNFFTIHVNEPTRITENSSTILDQILTNFPTLVKEVNVDAPLATSDHCLISIACLFKT